MSREDQRLLKGYAGNCILYMPAYTHLLGSVQAGIMLSQLVYWNNMGHHGNDGFFYKTVEEFYAETGLTKHQQRRAVIDLENNGLIEVKYARVPRKRHFKVNRITIESRLIEWRKSLDPEIRKALFQSSEKRRTITEITPKEYTDNISLEIPDFYDSGEVIDV